MSISDNLQRARRLRGLSLRELARRAGVSATAISKYERGLDAPGSGVLMRLAKALDLPLDALVRSPLPAARVEELAFRGGDSLSGRQRARVWAAVEDWLSRYLEIERLLGLDLRRDWLPPGFPRCITYLAEAEEAASDLRVAWGLGASPIANLVESLEAHGVKVGTLAADLGPLDACGAARSGGSDVPFVLVQANAPADRQRFSLAHELAHLLLRLSPECDEERVANRFAAALLLPAAAVIRELGPRRRSLHRAELVALKATYGASAQAWIQRAFELGVISDRGRRHAFRMLAAHGEARAEVGVALPPERSTRLPRLVARAVAEGVISVARGRELLRGDAEGWLAPILPRDEPPPSMLV